MKKLLLLLVLLVVSSIGAQEIEEGKYSFKTSHRRQIVEIKPTQVLTYSKRIQMKIYEITERRNIEGVEQIICDMENGYELIISQTMNGKNLFMYKRTPNDKPSTNLKYWHVKKRQSNKLRKIKLTQTKINW